MLYQPILLDTKGKDVLDKERVISEVSNVYQDTGIDKASIFEIRAEGKSIGIESLQRFTNWIWNKNEELKLLLIFQAEKLTDAAQNSLLKVVEEPPKETIIVLISKNTDTLLHTIISRCINIGVKAESLEERILPEFVKGNYIDRVRIIEILIKDDNSRENALKLVEELINYYLGDKDNLDKSDKLLEIYIGINKGVNLKLSLSLVNTLVST